MSANGAQILALGGEHGGCPERRPDARAPDRAEQQPERELALEARGAEAAEAVLGPAADRCGDGRDLHLQLRHEQDDPDRDQQQRGGDAKESAVEPDPVADRRDKQADRDERERKAGRERRRPELVLAHRGAEYDRQQRQDARRQRGETSRDEGEGDAAECHVRLRYLEVLFKSSSIEAALVSPTERPVSLAPLKAISVLCERAPKLFTTSGWLSKSTLKMVSLS